jgi:thiamine-monophosphate kinase
MPNPSEFEVIERFFTRASTDASVIVGIGDDAAIVAAEGRLALAVDMLVAGTHFPRELPARAVGHRALAVNLSDLAAVGAVPHWATLALSVPSAEEAWLSEFAAGFFTLADQHGVVLIGGDTTRGPLTVTVQLAGAAPELPLLRAGGRPGDRVFVSGTLGDAAAALELLERPASERGAEEAFLVQRFCYPEPRVALGRALVGTACAAIDVSDGLLADLGRLCAASGCGAEVDLAALPLSDALKARFARERGEQFALGGGDDYELCFAGAPGDVAKIQALAANALTRVTEIGVLTAEPGLYGRRGDRTVALAATGFDHFASS